MTSEGTMLLVMVQVSGMSSFDYNFSVIPSDLTATGGPGWSCPLCMGHLCHCAMLDASCVTFGNGCAMSMSDSGLAECWTLSTAAVMCTMSARVPTPN